MRVPRTCHDVNNMATIPCTQSRDASRLTPLGFHGPHHRVRAHVFASDPILRPPDSRGGTTMSINFNPNDPQAGSTAPAMREKGPRANRPTSKSVFTFTGTSQEGKFNPDTPQFLFWQCREAALAAVETWESV